MSASRVCHVCSKAIDAIKRDNETITSHSAKRAKSLHKTGGAGASPARSDSDQQGSIVSDRHEN
jgi:hypothetical protein